MNSEGPLPAPSAPPSQLSGQVSAPYPEAQEGYALDRQASYPSEQQQQPNYPQPQQPVEEPPLLSNAPPSYSDVADQRLSYTQPLQQASPQYPMQQQQAAYPVHQQPAAAYPVHQQPAYPVQQQPAYPVQQQPAYPVQQQPAYQQQQPQYYANPPSYYPEQQQQQQNTVVVVQPSAVVTTTAVQQPYVANYGQGALLFGIITTFIFAFCGCWPCLLFSVLAIVFASNANSSAAAGNMSSAKTNRNASYGLSITSTSIVASGILAFVIYLIAIFSAS